MDHGKEIFDEEKEMNNNELEYLQKIYEKHYEKINSCSNTIKITNIISICSFLCFLTLLAVRSSFTFSWFILLLPSYVSIISITILLNNFLKLKDIFDEVQRPEGKDEKEDVSRIGSIMSYFSLYAISLCTLTYVLLISLQLEGYTALGWNVVAIPLYLSLATATLYWVFILPAFYQNKLYSEITLMLVYLVCSFVFTLLINFKLDNNYNNTYFNICLSFLFALGLHFVYATINTVNCSKGELYSRLSTIIFLLCTFGSLVLVGLMADGLLTKMKYWTPVLVFTLGFVIFVSEKIMEYIKGDKEEESSEIKTR